MIPTSLRMAKSDFNFIFLKKSELRLFLPSFVVNFYSNPWGILKFSVIVSKKNISKASHRNLVKRRIKHLINLNKNKITPGYYVFVIKNNLQVTNLTYEKLSSDFYSFLSKVSKS